MLVFVGMECSGVIRRAFEEQGHEAWSCDFKPAEDGSARHIQGDVFEVAEKMEPDLAILHPDCTLLTSSGYHWCYADPDKFPHTLVGEARTRAADRARFFPGIARAMAQQWGIFAFRSPSQANLL